MRLSRTWSLPKGAAHVSYFSKPSPSLSFFFLLSVLFLSRSSFFPLSFFFSCLVPVRPFCFFIPFPCLSFPFLQLHGKAKRLQLCCKCPLQFPCVVCPMHTKPVPHPAWRRGWGLPALTVTQRSAFFGHLFTTCFVLWVPTSSCQCHFLSSMAPLSNICSGFSSFGKAECCGYQLCRRALEKVRSCDFGHSSSAGGGLSKCPRGREHFQALPEGMLQGNLRAIRQSCWIASFPCNGAWACFLGKAI